ncbi:rabankyrin-5 [Nilaparvata lugens]|uniref:rabankyrin-5 n=1 Tax=Nilaparvata lugens TaxID=108931 RepID=UPI000B99A237|nr:rabankyrin-5 [Nilaparvata lugens]
MNNFEKGNEINKREQHLSLLKEEYVKLQSYCSDLERKYALASASIGDLNENSFVSSLLKTVTSLHKNTLFSDMKVKLEDHVVPAHKIVFASRNSTWGISKSIEQIDILDWSHLGKDVGSAVLKWVYTDQIDFSKGDDFTLSLMKTANDFKLEEVVSKSEKALMASVNVKNCVRFYSTADEIGAETLKEHCSSLISANWDDFSSEDFAHMRAPLLYEMFKRNTSYPLHSAVRLRREDVVFLFLVEHHSQLPTILNALDNRGDLALDMALKEQQTSIARTLIENGADPDAKDPKGWTITHRAVERGDAFSAKFLIENGASVAITTPERGHSLLHLIASSSHHSDAESAMAEIAKRLLDSNFDPNLQDKEGVTALHLAVMARNEDIFSLLLTKSVNLNVQTHEGHAPLWYALIASSRYNSNSFAARLIEKGAVPNPIYAQTSDSLLHRVAEEGLEDAGLFLCTHANNINHTNRKGETCLHKACEKGLSRLVTKLLECGANPNVQTFPPDDLSINSDDVPSYRQTPIHIAIRYHNDNAVKAILEYKSTLDDVKDALMPNLNLKDSKGDTPISLALTTKMQNLVADLIQGGADVNIRNGEGLTLLHQAIINKDSETAIFLLNQGADVGAITADNLTPLQLGIKHEQPSVVEALCRRGVDLSSLDADKNCPLWVALNTNQEAIASILVRHGVDTDCWGEGPDGCMQTLLHRAIDENKQSVARFLIQSGCDVDSPRRPGAGGRGGDEARDQQSPLHLCCQWGLNEVVQTLVEHGANINSKDADGKTPLHVAIQNQHISIFTLLLCHPRIDLSIRDKSGLTPFATALTCHDTRAAKAILDKLPTAAEQYDNKGRNFLHTAVQKNDVETVLFLLSIQVDVNSRVQDSNQTPTLHLAAATANEMLVRNLLLAGAKPNDRDVCRRTALHVAAEAGHTEVVIALMQNSVDFDAVDVEGDNALHIAAREGHYAVAKALLTESELNAEALNLKGRNPLHVLARYARENAATICELFLETMPKYPLDKPDLEGNTALMLAYMKGNGNLCRSLVKAGACVGTMNKNGITIFNYQVATKTLLYNLLDHLSNEPPWAEGDICLECGTKFGITMRKHHCRHCGRLLCSSCSSFEMPILKFNLNKPVRVCGVCLDVLQFRCA